MYIHFKEVLCSKLNRLFKGIETYIQTLISLEPDVENF